jgi:hypothetical protein
METMLFAYTLKIVKRKDFSVNFGKNPSRIWRAQSNFNPPPFQPQKNIAFYQGNS